MSIWNENLSNLLAMIRKSFSFCSFLLLLAGCVVARAEPRQQTRPPADAAAAFTALADRLLKAERVRLHVHATAEGAVVVDLRGALHMGPADQVSFTASGAFAGKPVDLALRSDRGELRIGSTTVRTPDHLKEALLIGLRRMGILHNLARLTAAREPDRANGGVRESVTVSAFGARARESDALSFEITVAGQPAGSASLELDASGRPVARRQIVKFPSGEMRVTERYSSVIIET